MTQRALAGTLSDRVREAAFHVFAVGALPMGVQRMLGMVCSKCVPPGLHGVCYLCSVKAADDKKTLSR